MKEVRGNFGKEKWDKAEIKGRKILECICLCHLHCMYACCKLLHVDNHEYCLIFQCITIFSMLYILLSCKEMFLSHLYSFSPQKSNPRRPCNLSSGIQL